MEARAVDQVTGAAIVYDTAIANAQPLAATSFTFGAGAAEPVTGGGDPRLSFSLGQSFAFGYYFADRLGNAGATRMQPGASDVPTFTFDTAVIRLDSIATPATAGARHGYVAGVGWAYFTAIAAGSTTIRSSATIATNDVRQGQAATVTITP
jgi:hypothetical protein